MTESVSFPALGSSAVVVVCDGERLTAGVEAVKRMVAAFDLACSRFREDSELSALNRAGGRAMCVSGLLREAVAAGVRAAELTEGDVDPTLGDALVALGYDRDFDVGLDGRGVRGAASPNRRLALTSIAGWRTIRIDVEAGTVGLGHGVSLDLGATA